jgi:hypothetical protein
VECSCKCGYEPSGSIKCWETIKWLHNCGLSSSSQFHRVSWLVHIASVWDWAGPMKDLSFVLNRGENFSSTMSDLKAKLPLCLTN